MLEILDVNRTWWWRSIVVHGIPFTISVLLWVGTVMWARHVLHALPPWKKELGTLSISIIQKE